GVYTVRRYGDLGACGRRVAAIDTTTPRHLTGSDGIMLQIEAIHICADMADGLEARLYDPLWLLGRQWQTGEFKADDAGMPIAAHIVFEETPLSVWQAGGSDSTEPVLPYAPLVQPLEPLVEGEPLALSDRPAVHQAVELGLHLKRMLER